jgi:hypothetical protein
MKIHPLIFPLLLLAMLKPVVARSKRAPTILDKSMYIDANLFKSDLQWFQDPKFFSHSNVLLAK